MAYTIENNYTGNGSTRIYSFTFPYLEDTDIKVTLNQVATTNFELANATQINFTADSGGETSTQAATGAPKSSVAIRIYRDTNIDNLQSEFFSGSAVRAQDLNNDFNQTLYVSQETEKAVEGKWNDSSQTLDSSEAFVDSNDYIMTAAAIDDRIVANVAAHALTDGKIWVGNGSNVGAQVTPSGDVTMSNTGAFTIANTSVETGMIANDAINGTKIADDAINSEHYAADSIDTEHYAPNSVDTTALAADCVTAAQIGDDVISTEHYASNSVDTTALAADAVTGAQIADNAIDSEHYTDGSIDAAHIANDAIDSQHYAADSIDTEHYAANSVDSTAIADDAVTATQIAGASVTAAKIGTNAVTTEKINDNAVTGAKLAALTDTQILVGNGSNVATGVAVSGDITIANTGAVTIANNAVEIGMIGCEQTTISDSDSHIPTSGAVVDYVAAQIAPIGGLEVIADEDNFPTTQPASGVVISIADAGGVVFNGSGVSTTARTAGNGSDNVTINNAPSSLYSETLAAGVGMQVSSTGSSHTYNYHKILAKEADVKQLSDDINDFNSRYRINAGEPSSNNDDGDLVWDTNADKMKVYDGTASAWKEVTSSGDFKYLFLCPAGGTGAPTLDGSIATYDLRESSNSGSAASVTSAAQLIVSIDGVVQKANTGTSAPAEGFALVDSNTIIFGSNLASGASVFIVQIGSAVSIPTPGDGTVSAAKIASGAVTTAKIGADAVDGTKIADDAIDSEHYTDGSIDNAHLADNAVDLAEMAHGTQGDVLYYGSGGAPTRLGAGTNGYFLKTQGGSANPVWAEVAGGVSSDAQQNTLAGTNAGNSFTGTDANNNTLIGYDAGTEITTGDGNTAIGRQALDTNTTGSYNTAIGEVCLQAATTADYNTAMGRYTMYANTTGHSNTALGYNALGTNTTGHSNISVGYQSLKDNTTGYQAVAIGHQAAENNTEGIANIAIGYRALDTNTTGDTNVAIGYQALFANTTQDNTVAIGTYALDALTTGAKNVAIGYNALTSITTGSDCTAVGYQALQNNLNGNNTAVGREAMKVSTTADYCTALGSQALDALTTANMNTGLGYQALSATTTGADNTAVGSECGDANTTGYSNVFIGKACGGANTTGFYNTFVGESSGYSHTTGDSNTAVGHYAYQAGTTGTANVCVGRNAGMALTTGHNNVAIGFNAMKSQDTADYNIAIGREALEALNEDKEDNIAIGFRALHNLTDGQWNTAVGSYALHDCTASPDRNTAIGKEAGYTVTTGDNNLLLGYNAGTSGSPSGAITTANNNICLGDSNIGELWCADSGINTSDKRDKTDIVNFTHGLNWVNQLNPVTYRWDKRCWYDDNTPDGSKKRDQLHVGFLAQDVLAIEGNPTKADTLIAHLNCDGSAYGLKYERIVPVLVNAIKELSTEVNTLKTKVAALEAG